MVRVKVRLDVMRRQVDVDCETKVRLWSWSAFCHKRNICMKDCVET